MKYHVDDDFLYEHMPQAEQNKINQLPEDASIEHDFSPAFLQNMERLICEEKTVTRPKTYRFLWKTAIAILLVAVGIKAGSVLKDYFLSPPGKGSQLSTSFITKEPMYVPEGFSIQECLGDGSRYTIHYINGQQESIHYQQCSLENEANSFDIDGIKTETVMVRSQEVYLFYSADQPHLYWEDDTCFYLLMGNVDKDELLKMCESVLE